MELKGKIINFLGDSITEGVGVSCESAIYSNVFGKIAGLKLVRNYGISGTRLAVQQGEETKYDDGYFCGRFHKMNNNADIVVVFGGTNDYGHGDAPFGSFDDRTPDTFCGAVHCLMKGLIEKYPAARVVFMTPLHRTGDFVPNPVTGKPLKSYSDAIKEIGEYYSVPVLDLFATAGIQPNIDVQRELFCPDGLHPNDAGAKRIAYRLKAFLEAL